MSSTDRRNDYRLVETVGNGQSIGPAGSHLANAGLILGEGNIPDLKWNETTWDGSYDWAARGEEWSGPWGSSEAQWFGAMWRSTRC